MRINNLELTNWRNHKKASFAFDRVNVIRGANASGKSSIAMGIEFLLTGRCEVTNEAGGDGELLITQGAKKATLSATLADPACSIVRERSMAGGNLLIEKGDQQFAGKQAMYLLPAADMLSLVLRSARFLDLPPAEQSRLLASAVEPREFEFAADIIEKARLVGSVIPRKISSIKEAETCKGHFYDKRTTLGQELRALGDQPQPESNLPDLQEHRDKLKSLRKSLSEKQQAADRAETDYLAAVAHYDSLQAAVKRECDCASAKQLDGWSQIIDSYESAKPVMRRSMELREQIAVAEAEQAKVLKLGETCPTCKQAVTDAARTQVRQTIGLQVGTLKTELNALKPIPTGEEYEEARRKKGNALALIVQVTDAQNELRELEPPVRTAVDETLKKEIDELTQRVTKGDQVIADLAVAHERLRVFNKQALLKGQLQGRIAACASLVEYFGPGGVQKEIVGERLPILLAKLEARMATWGFHVTLLNETGAFSFAIRTAQDGPALDPWQLSASERFRFSVGLQVTLAELTGIKMVVIDAADILNGDGRRLLSRLVTESELDQAFILSSADSGVQTKNMDGPGLKFFWLGK